MKELRTLSLLSARAACLHNGCHTSHPGEKKTGSGSGVRRGDSHAFLSHVLVRHRGGVTCQVHFLPFFEHHVAAGAARAGRMVVFPSGLRGRRRGGRGGAGGEEPPRHKLAWLNSPARLQQGVICFSAAHKPETMWVRAHSGSAPGCGQPAVVRIWQMQTGREKPVGAAYSPSGDPPRVGHMKRAQSVSCDCFFLVLFFFVNVRVYWRELETSETEGWK